MIVWTFASDVLWWCDGSAKPVRIFSALGPVHVAVGENELYIYINGLICGKVTLQICETVVRGLQGVTKTTPPLPKFYKDRSSYVRDILGTESRHTANIEQN